MNNRRNINFNNSRTFSKPSNRGRGRGRGRGTKRNFSSFNSSNVNINQPNKRQRLNTFGSGIQKINSHLNSSNTASRKIISKKNTVANLKFTINNNTTPTPKKNTRNITTIASLKPQIKKSNKIILLNKQVTKPIKPKRNIQKKPIKSKSFSKITPISKSVKKNINNNSNKIVIENNSDNDNNNNQTSQSPTNSEEQNEVKIKSLRALLMQTYNKTKPTAEKTKKTIESKKIISLNITNKDIKDSQKINKKIVPKINKKLIINKKVVNKKIIKTDPQKKIVKSKVTNNNNNNNNNNTIKKFKKPTLNLIPKPKLIPIKQGLTLSKDDIMTDLQKKIKEDGLEFEYNEEDEKFIEEEILKYKLDKEYHLSAQNWEFWIKLGVFEKKDIEFKKLKLLQNLWKNYKTQIQSKIKNCEEENSMNIREFEIDFDLLEN